MNLLPMNIRADANILCFVILFYLSEIKLNMYNLIL